MKKTHIYILLIAVTILLVLERYSFFNFLNFKELYFEGLKNEGLNEEGIELSTKLEIWVFPLSILIKFIKMFFIASFIYLGCLLFNYTKKFKHIFLVVLAAEIVFVISGLINFFILKTNLDSIDSIVYLKRYQVLSLQNFYDFNSISETIFTAFGSISFFQIAYWFALAFGLKYIIKKPFFKSFEVVLYSYVSVFVLVILSKVLISINFS